MSASDQDSINIAGEVTLDENTEIPLLLAVQCNEEKTVHSLLREDPQSVNIRNELGRTALYIAAEQGHTFIVKLLLDHGAEINIPSHRGNTPLHAAIWYQKAETAEFLINNGAEISACTVTGLMPLHFAVKKNLKRIAKILLDRNIPADVKTIYDFTPLHYAAKNRDPDLVKLFLSLGIPVNTLTKNNQTPLHIAAHRGNVEVAKCLVEQKAVIDAEKRDFTTPLHLAAERGNVEMVRYLINHGADVNKTSDEGGTPLHRATFSRNPKIAEILLNKGAKVDAKTGREATPLHLAVQKNCVDMVKLLLEYGADVNNKDAQGQNALCFFSDDGGEIAEVLMDYGVDVNSTDKIGKTALFQVYINAGETVAIAKLLVKIMAKMISTDQVVSEKNQLLLKLKNPGIFFEKCNKEIERMKTRVIDDIYNITFYDVLTKDVKKLAVYAKFRNVIDAFEDGKYRKEFPLYANMLERRYKIGKEKNDLFEAGAAAFNLLFQYKLPQFVENNAKAIDDQFKNGFEVPDLVVRKLFSYLSVMDLRTLSNLSGESGDWETADIEGVIINSPFKKMKILQD